jgi:hypothetical protein
VVRKNRIGEDIDGKDGSEGFESASNPFAAVGIIDPRNGIDSGQKRSADTSLATMDHSHLVMPELFCA